MSPKRFDKGSVLHLPLSNFKKILYVHMDNSALEVEEKHLQHCPPGIDVASACATRKVLLEQLGRVLPSDVDTLPDKVFLANTADHYGAR
jgi:hypothetical protein